MSDHHRSSYYKDSYGSSSSKRYHSPSEPPPRMMSSGDYYDSSDSRSKRSRTDNFGAHTTTTRYAEYSASSSSSASGSRYKTASSSYYDLPGYKPSASSSSSSKYLDDYKGSGSSSRSAPKSNMRRIPPPLTPPSLSSKSSSMRLQPLMKVSLSSSSSGVGSGSSKDYYGSRVRQAPPEHHYPYSGGSASHSSSTYSKPDFKRPVSYGSSKSLPSSSYHSNARHNSNLPFRSTTAAASRRLLARSRAPPPPSGMNSRNRGRNTMMNSRRDPPMRSRKMMPTKHSYKRSRSRSRSRSDDKGSKGSKEKKDNEEVDKTVGKKDDDAMDYVNMVEGQVVVEEVAGDDDDDVDQEENGHLEGKSGSAEQTGKVDDRSQDDKSVRTNEEDSKVEVKTENDGEKSGAAEKPSTDEQGKSPTTRALLKLHCPYCDVRCISFREFTFHLRSNQHVRTMHGAVTEMKKKLMKVRQEMKEDQRKREKAEKVLSDTSSYCRVCELSFRTDPKEHEANEIHNKIKTLIYRRCDVCDIDFRIWKVHIYHMAALEHAKRVAMKELQEGDVKGDNVKGTNLSPEELGLDLIEIRTVFYCNACIRYIPIKGEVDEAKKVHCMTLNHLKSVEEYNEREKRRLMREEARERAKRRKQEETEKELKEKDPNTSGELDKTADESLTTDKSEEGAEKTLVDVKKEPIDGETGEKNDMDTSGEVQGNVIEKDTKDPGETSADKEQGGNRNEAEEDDDDEIELHAGEDDVEDESEDTGDWSRRTRSSQRGDASSI